MKFNVLHKRGFSLLELVVVVIIAALVTLAVVGSYASMKQRRSLKTAMESLNSALVTARSYAVSHNAWHRLVFQFRPATGQPDEFLYWIDEIAPASNTTINPQALEPAVKAKLTTPERFPASVSVLDATINGVTVVPANSNYMVIRFFPDGSSDDVTIRLLEDSTVGQRGNAIGTIRLFGATAKPKMIDGLSP